MKEAFWQRKANTFNKSTDMEKPFLKNKSRKILISNLTHKAYFQTPKKKNMKFKTNAPTKY